MLQTGNGLLYVIVVVVLVDDDDDDLVCRVRAWPKPRPQAQLDLSAAARWMPAATGLQQSAMETEDSCG